MDGLGPGDGHAQTAALQLTGITKTFGAHCAVNNLDLRVNPGEFYALLGPNGAGKTTTLRMIANLLKPDAGHISIFGIDARADPIFPSDGSRSTNLILLSSAKHAFWACF